MRWWARPIAKEPAPETTDLPRALLEGVRVLETAERVSGPYCARILAGLGAEVVKVEPPGGDEARAMGPFPGDVSHPEKSGLFLALNTDKQSITLDLASGADSEAFLSLVEGTDIVIDNHAPGWLGTAGVGFDRLASRQGAVVLTEITPFGSWGPYAGLSAGDLTLFHMSGNAPGLLGPVSDPESEPPIRAGGHQSEFVAGMAAATATLMALYRRRTAGAGAHVIVSSFEAMVTQAMAGLAGSAFGRPVPPRSLARQSEEAGAGAVGAIGGVLPCADGYVAISPREDAQWLRWLEMMGQPSWANDDRFATREARQDNIGGLWELLSVWTRTRSKFDIAREGQSRRIPCFPVNTVEDLMKDRHLEERQFFVPVEHPVAGSLRLPGVPYRLSDARVPAGSVPAPRLGQHNETVLAGVRGQP
jgi:crotonobetainyl-CoA:carnitine CoA-transferase CaiB-like acyl-CoA transferase